MKHTTLIRMEMRTGKAWFRKGKHYYRSPFDGKVRLVPKGHKLKVRIG